MEQVGVITFFLSSVLDNLTSTIVMVSLLRKLVSNPEQRRYCLFFYPELQWNQSWHICDFQMDLLMDMAVGCARFLGAVVVIAANAGGAWTPIGDVTTTMLWIHGQISTLRTMQDLFLPSMVSLAVPLALMTLSR
jgi:Na+/H+ antiporter NhaD/arsenite permease-like protein